MASAGINSRSFAQQVIPIIKPPALSLKRMIVATPGLTSGRRRVKLQNLRGTKMPQRNR